MTNRLAELRTLQLEAAARAEWRSDPSPQKQRPHEAGPENHVRDEKLAAHAFGYRRRGRAGLAHDHELGHPGGMQGAEEAVLPGAGEPVREGALPHARRRE